MSKEYFRGRCCWGGREYLQRSFLRRLVILFLSFSGLLYGRGAGTVVNSSDTSHGAAWFDVKAYGAKGDGMSDDCPSIRNAIRAASANKPARVYFPPGKYRCGSLDASVTQNMQWAFPNVDQLEIFGYEATIEMGNGVLISGLRTEAAWGGGGFLCNRGSYVNIHDLILDWNGVNNLAPSGKATMGYPVLFLGCSFSRVTDLTIKDNPGRNDIVDGGGQKGAYNYIGRNYLINGGTTLPGNFFQDDYSSIYVDSLHTIIEGNKILRSQPPPAVHPHAGGIELHGTGDVARSNYVQYGAPGVYIAADAEAVSGEDITVAGNTCDRCANGIYFTGRTDFHDITIRDNHILLLPIPGLSGQIIGIAHLRSDNGVFGYTNIIYGANISGNEIRDVGNLPRKNPAAIGIRLTSLSNVRISGNVIGPLASAAIELIGSPYVFDDVLVAGNAIKNASYSGDALNPTIALDMTGSSTSPQKAHYDASNILFDGNVVVNRNPDTGNAAFYWVWGRGSVISNIHVSGSNLVDGYGVQSGGPNSPAICFRCEGGSSGAASPSKAATEK